MECAGPVLLFLFLDRLGVARAGGAGGPGSCIGLVESFCPLCFSFLFFSSSALSGPVKKRNRVEMREVL